MTRYFPLALAALMVIGFVIAVFTVGDGGVDFVDDIASSRSGRPDDESTDVLWPIGLLVPIMAFVIGASYFGADQKSGMIEQLLTWEPRRFRLLLGRLAGGMAALVVITMLLSFFLVVLLYLLASVTGTTEGTSDIWLKVLGAVVRSGIVGAIFFAIGLAVTVIANNSVASIVGFLIYMLVIESLFEAFLSQVGVWLPFVNARAFVARDSLRENQFDSGFPGQIFDVHHGYIGALFILAAWAAIAYVIALALFERRDID